VHDPRQPLLIGSMLIIGFVLIFGSVSFGVSFWSWRFRFFSPAITFLTISVMSSPIAGPVTASKRVSFMSRSWLIFGRHPVIMIFLLFGVCLMASIMRFSVGPFTAQVLKINRSASASCLVSSYPAFVRHPAMTSLSEVFAEQPYVFMLIFMGSRLVIPLDGSSSIKKLEVLWGGY